MEPLPPADLALARRLERAEALANASFVTARAQLDPGSGAAWIDIAGTYAMFDGVGSPLTQTFGLGLFEPFLAPEFERAEAFFSERGATTSHEVSSFAPQATTRLLPERGYAPIEQSTVLLRTTAPDGAGTHREISVRVIGVDEREEWARVAAAGWRSEGEALSAFIGEFGQVSTRAEGVRCFVAELHGRPIAAGSLFLSPDVALLAGASTIPEARRRGAQSALLQARLAYAAARGIALAMIVAQPGSASQRNAERRGFRAMYSRTKWERR